MATTQISTVHSEETNTPPVHRAEQLVGAGKQAHILLGDQTYILRITRAGKLILTK
ncbi:hemin uptake protein HemP [Chachezhania sediminis]|uniref:hemin uptake protein HemP n=1 Tax=Chachezhania sediminis TaxID=2599291 RepID=UPI00131B146B|nr:hemin uptake protein HemP [Chachezhania sediminis]